jgi:hypothetical protein
VFRPQTSRVAHCEHAQGESYLEARHQVTTEREPRVTENTDNKQRDNQCLRLWGVIAKVRPTPEHPSYYDWQHGFLVIVLYSNKPDSACASAKSIIDQLPYELVGAEVAVLDAERLADRCAGAIAGGQQLGLGLLLVAFAPGSDAAEFEAINFC